MPKISTNPNDVQNPINNISDKVQAQSGGDPKIIAKRHKYRYLIVIELQKWTTIQSE